MEISYCSIAIAISIAISFWEKVLTILDPALGRLQLDPTDLGSQAVNLSLDRSDLISFKDSKCLSLV